MRTLHILFAAAAVLVGACATEDGITVTEVPKGSETIRSPQAPQGTSLWILPPGWRRLDAERPMRLHTFLAPVAGDDLEVALSRFPGEVGGMLANVNRWRGQIGLEPVGEADAEAMIQRFAHPGFRGYTLHLQGTERHMLVGSIYEAGADRTWFVRATVTPDQAPQLRPALFDFARSFGTATAD